MARVHAQKRTNNRVDPPPAFERSCRKPMEHWSCCRRLELSLEGAVTEIELVGCVTTNSSNARYQ